MAGYPRPGVLANSNGFSVAGPLALPGGVVYGQDAPVIREFLAAVSLNGGDAVVLAPSLASLGYFVTKTSVIDNLVPIGIVTGARVGAVAASAASQPVWVVVQGPAWGNAGVSTIAAGNLVGLSSVAAGQLANNSNLGVAMKTYGATVSFAASVTSIGANAYLDVTVTQGAPYSSLDVPTAFIPNASLGQGIVIGEIWPAASNQWGIRLANVTSVAFASQASIQGTLVTAKVSQPTYGTILGTALGSVSASGLPLPVFVRPV